MVIPRQRILDGKPVWSIYDTSTGFLFNGTHFLHNFEERCDCETAIKMYINNGILEEETEIEKVQDGSGYICYTVPRD